MKVIGRGTEQVNYSTQNTKDLKLDSNKLLITISLENKSEHRATL